MKLFLAIIANKLRQMQKQNKIHEQAEVVRELDKIRLRRVLRMWEEGVYCARIMDGDSWRAFRALQVRRLGCSHTKTPLLQRIHTKTPLLQRIHTKTPLSQRIHTKTPLSQRIHTKAPLLKRALQERPFPTTWAASLL